MSWYHGACGMGLTYLMTLSMEWSLRNDPLFCAQGIELKMIKDDDMHVLGEMRR